MASGIVIRFVRRFGCQCGHTREYDGKKKYRTDDNSRIPSKSNQCPAIASMRTDNDVIQSNSEELNTSHSPGIGDCEVWKIGCETTFMRDETGIFDD